MWHANHFAIFMFGSNQRGGLSIGILTETFAGAGGARTFADGIDIGGEIPNPISRMANVETIEATFPIRYLFRRRLRDSGGPGQLPRRHRRRDRDRRRTTRPTAASTTSSPARARSFPRAKAWRAVIPAESTTTSGSRREGNASSPSFATRVEGIEGKRQPVSWGVYPLKGQDALYVRWNGGGGIGDPLQRDPARVLDDVVSQSVSPQGGP